MKALHKATIIIKTALRFRKAVCGALCSGLSRALKTPHRGVFAPRYAERGARAVLVPDGAPIRSVPGNCNKKQPYAYRKAVCGAPCGSKPEHFCLSGRHRHHTAAHPEVMLLFLRARIKDGC